MEKFNPPLPQFETSPADTEHETRSLSPEKLLGEPKEFSALVQGAANTIHTRASGREIVVVTVTGEPTSSSLAAAIATRLEAPLIEIIPKELADKEKGTGRTIRVAKDIGGDPYYVLVTPEVSNPQSLQQTIEALRKEKSGKFANASFSVCTGEKMELNLTNIPQIEDVFAPAPNESSPRSYERTPNYSSSEELQHGYIEALAMTGAVKIASSLEDRFTLRAKKSDGTPNRSFLYVDTSDITASAESRNLLMAAVENLLTENVGRDNLHRVVLISVEGKSSNAMCGVCRDHLQLPQIEVARAGENNTENNLIYFPDHLPADPIFVMLDGVLTSGQTVLEAHTALKEAHPKIFKTGTDIRLVVGLARDPEDVALKRLADTGFNNVASVATLEHAIASRWENLTDQQRRGIQEELSPGQNNKLNTLLTKLTNK